MACDFCEGKTCLFKGEVKLWIQDGVLVAATRFSSREEYEINNCLMCGEDMAKYRKEANDGEVH